MKILTALFILCIALSFGEQLNKNSEQFDKIGQIAANFAKVDNENYEVISVNKAINGEAETEYTVRIVLKQPSERLCTVGLLESPSPDAASGNQYSLLAAQCVSSVTEPPIHQVKRPPLGGFTIFENLEDELLKEKVAFALDHYNSRLVRGEQPLELIKIVEAKSQVVAGIKYIFTLQLGRGGKVEEVCEISLWEKSWEKFREAHVIKCEPELESNRQAKQGFVDKQEEVVLDPSTMPFLKNVIDKAVESLNGVYSFYNVQKRINDITKASVINSVNGPIYKLKLDVDSLTCASPLYRGTCKKYLHSSREECDLSVLDQSRAFIDHPFKLLESGCTNQENYYLPLKKKKRSVFGGRRNFNLTSEEESELVEFTESAIEEDMQTDYRLKVIEVLNSRIQTVSGRMYHLTLDIARTTCHRNSVYRRQTCLEDTAKGRLLCEVKVWVQPWRNFRKLTNYTCTDSNAWDSTLSDEDKQIAAKFKYWAEKYDKKYSSADEWISRFTIFKDNLDKIRLLQKEELGTGVYGPTEFADLTAEEFSSRLGLRRRKNSKERYKQAKIPHITLPESFDWRDHKAVTSVKNQGFCGSCWAFSVIGNIEGQYAIRKGKLYDLSAQELVDCDMMDEGCSGGYMWDAYMATMKLGGLETEKDYPYVGSSTEKCYFDDEKIKVAIKGALNITHNETDMAKWLVKNGPMSIGINAMAMQFYFGGVSHPPKLLCDPEGMDHGVLIVGYGIHTTWLLKRELPYWIVKNSWGTSWGQRGYYLVYRGDGTCGVNTYVTSAIV